MAILSDLVDEDKTTNNTSALSPPAAKKQFSAALDPADPLGFLEKVFDFVGRESDFFKSDSLVSDVSAVVRMVKSNLDSEEKKRKEASAAEKKGETEEKKKKMKEEVVVEKKEEEKSERLTPNKINGLDMEKYSWGQQLHEATITVPVPAGTNARSIVCEIKRNHLKVGIKGQEPIIDGELFKPVKVDDSTWTLEDKKLVSILLCKVDRMDWWKYLVKGEPEIDTQKVEPEGSRLSDLDGEMRSTVEKMMFDQRQKQMGLPTSEEIKNQELMKMFMEQNPNMNFSGGNGGNPNMMNFAGGSPNMMNFAGGSPNMMNFPGGKFNGKMPPF